MEKTNLEEFSKEELIESITDYVPLEKKDPDQKQLRELIELRDENRKDIQFHEDRLEQYEDSFVEAGRFRHKSVVERLNASQGKSPAGKHEEVLKVPMAKMQQLADNIENTKLALETLKQKDIGYGGAINAIRAKLREKKIDEITKTAFKEFGKMLEFYKVADNHFHNVVKPAVDAAYEADSLFHDINGRAMRLGMPKLISHVIANKLKQDATADVSLDTIIEHIRDNYDSFGIENMILPKFYDKDIDIDYYKPHF